MKAEWVTYEVYDKMTVRTYALKWCSTRHHFHKLVEVDSSGTVFVDFINDAVQLLVRQLVVQFTQNLLQGRDRDVSVALNQNDITIENTPLLNKKVSKVWIWNYSCWWMFVSTSSLPALSYILNASRSSFFMLSSSSGSTKNFAASWDKTSSSH